MRFGDDSGAACTRPAIRGVHLQPLNRKITEVNREIGRLMTRRSAYERVKGATRDQLKEKNG